MFTIFLSSKIDSSNIWVIESNFIDIDLDHIRIHLSEVLKQPVLKLFLRKICWLLETHAEQR